MVYTVSSGSPRAPTAPCQVCRRGLLLCAYNSSFSSSSQVVGRRRPRGTLGCTSRMRVCGTGAATAPAKGPNLRSFLEILGPFFGTSNPVVVRSNRTGRASKKDAGLSRRGNRASLGRVPFVSHCRWSGCRAKLRNRSVEGSERTESKLRGCASTSCTRLTRSDPAGIGLRLRLVARGVLDDAAMHAPRNQDGPGVVRRR